MTTEETKMHRPTPPRVPAQAGTHISERAQRTELWAPASAGAREKERKKPTTGSRPITFT